MILRKYIPTLFVGLTTVSAVCAQMPDPPPPAAGGPIGAPGRAPGGPEAVLPPAPGRPSSAAATSISGVVESYLLNPSGQIDGLLLTDGKQLHLPPHLGSTLQQTVMRGDRIQAAVEPGAISSYGQEYRTVSLTNCKSKATLIDQPPTIPPTPPAPPTSGQIISAKGKLTHWLVGHMGEANGFVLSDGAQVHFPPTLCPTLNQELKIGESISAQGYGTHSLLGTSLDMTTVSADGKNIPLSNQ